MKNFFKAIGDFFKNLFSANNLHAFEEWLKEVFTAEKALMIVQLKAFATQAVATAEQTGLDSEAKRKMALNSILAQAQTAGMVAGASAIALALEMAVSALRNKQQASIQ